MPGYNHKQEAEIAFDNNKKRLRAEANILMSTALNEALRRMAEDFNSSLHAGVILELQDPEEYVKRAFKDVL